MLLPPGTYTVTVTSPGFNKLVEVEHCSYDWRAGATLPEHADWVLSRIVKVVTVSTGHRISSRPSLSPVPSPSISLRIENLNPVSPQLPSASP